MNSEQAPNIDVVDQLLRAAFNTRTLRRFCKYDPLLNPVVSRFADSDGLDAMVEKVIDYCSEELIWPEFLAKVRQANPKQYARFENRLHSGVPPASPPLSVRVTATSERYVDFDLHIGPNGHTVATSVEGQAAAEVPIAIPASIESAINPLEKNETDNDLLKDLGRALYQWLFPSPIHTHFEKTAAVARVQGADIRLRLRIEPEEIASLPLEFLYRDIGGYYLAVNPDTVLSRYLSLPLPGDRRRRQAGPLHMLAIISNPRDQERLPPDEWEQILKEALAQPLAQGKLTLQTVKKATHKEIRNALLQQDPDIIQFVGHGTYRDGKGYLALVDKDLNITWKVDHDQFADMFLGHDDNLGLISLATCESAKAGDPQSFAGIAPKLVQRGVPAVLAMQYKVKIKTAKLFLETFYAAVAARKPVDWATQSARRAIAVEYGYGNREFATPVLFMRSEDGELF